MCVLKQRLTLMFQCNIYILSHQAKSYSHKSEVQIKHQFFESGSYNVVLAGLEHVIQVGCLINTDICLYLQFSRAAGIKGREPPSPAQIQFCEAPSFKTFETYLLYVSVEVVEIYFSCLKSTLSLEQFRTVSTMS